MKPNQITTRLSLAKHLLKKYGNTLYKPYQEQGVRWLLKRECTHRNDGTKLPSPYGGFLCDEMGLGKTIQFITLILANPVPNTLLVLPANLIQQWKSEFQRFAPDLQIYIHHGANRIWHPNVVLNRADTRPMVWITSYGLLRGINHQTTIFHKITWDRVIIEEAHTFRNSKSSISRAIKSLNSKYRWGITGTPIQNYLSDLVSLFGFLRIPGCILLRNLDYIKNKFILRRTKKEVAKYNSKLALPKIDIQIVAIPHQTNKELEFYQQSLELSWDCKLEVLLRLKQACILPQLVVDGYNKKFRNKIKSWKGTNTKLDTIIDDVIHNTQRIIIFTNFKSEMTYLQQKLDTHHISNQHIDGSTPLQVRADIIKSCYNIYDPTHPNYIQVLLIQINAGSTGLNLQMFSHIYFTSPHWNPAVEMQAIARAHRIGQTNKVVIKKYALVSNDSFTIEQHILSRQLHKRTLISEFLKDKDILYNGTTI